VLNLAPVEGISLPPYDIQLTIRSKCVKLG
jgi:hypothetical protein